MTFERLVKDIVPRHASAMILCFRFLSRMTQVYYCGLGSGGRDHFMRYGFDGKTALKK